MVRVNSLQEEKTARSKASSCENLKFSKNAVSLPIWLEC